MFYSFLFLCHFCLWLFQNVAFVNTKHRQLEEWLFFFHTQCEHNISQGFMGRMHPAALWLQKIHQYFHQIWSVVSQVFGIFGINTSTFVSSPVKHQALSVHSALKQSSYSLCNPSDRLSSLRDVLMLTWAITQNNSRCILRCTCCTNCSKIPDLTDSKHRLHWLFTLGTQSSFTQQHVLLWSQAT